VWFLPLINTRHNACPPLAGRPTFKRRAGASRDRLLNQIAFFIPINANVAASFLPGSTGAA
jgi:hypothetical protein